MFEAALQELVAETGAELALFCDYEGESIAVVAPGCDPFEARVLGAQQAPLVLQLQRVARQSGQSERLSLSCVAEQRVLLIEALPGGYYLVAALAPSPTWQRAAGPLRRLAARFAAEL
ncbi:hypothetical protein [Vulgatibacter sp.]|uniref:hypothetical protein n=1 Tax=Vulgatibacter sp. TaxID=1971226 RepID=UPI003566BC7D